MNLPQRKSSRAQWWDYSNIADYHITICTKENECFFGRNENGKMILSEEGKIAEEIWKMIPEKYPNIEMHEFIIMPNHLHGLLGFGAFDSPSPFGAFSPICTDAINRVRTNRRGEKNERSEENRGGATGASNPMIHFTLSTIIRWFKGRASFEIRKINPNFKWHGRFHDSIIKTYWQFENTKNYIRNNPKNWK